MKIMAWIRKKYLEWENTVYCNVHSLFQMKCYKNNKTNTKKNILKCRRVKRLEHLLMCLYIPQCMFSAGKCIYKRQNVQDNLPSQ